MKIEVDDDIETIPYLSSKNKTKKMMTQRQFYMHHCTIFPNMKLMKKYMLNQNLKLLKKLKKKTLKKEDDEQG